MHAISHTLFEWADNSYLIVGACYYPHPPRATVLYGKSNAVLVRRYFDPITRFTNRARNRLDVYHLDGSPRDCPQQVPAVILLEIPIKVFRHPARRCVLREAMNTRGKYPPLLSSIVT